MERLILYFIRPQVQHAQDPGRRRGWRIQSSTYSTGPVSYLDNNSSAERILFFDFPSAFNTIQPPLLQEKLTSMHVNPQLLITDYLTDRPQYSMS